MITTVRPSARRRRRRRAGLTALVLGSALIAVSAAPAARPLSGDPLVCAVDEQGRTVRIGDTVRDRFGREIGWVSATQCAANAPAGKLRIVPSVYGVVDLIEVDAAALLRADEGVTLALSAEQLDRSLNFARAQDSEVTS
jgi:hypothetical protein